MKTTRPTLAALGLAAMGYALWSALRSPDITPNRNGGFLLLVLVLHDALLLPVFLAAGALVRRVVPPSARATVQAALIASAAVTLIAVPLLLGYGRIADNPSALPLDYPRGLLLVLGGIWLAAAIAVAVKRIRVSNGRTGQTPTNDTQGAVAPQPPDASSRRDPASDAVTADPPPSPGVGSDS